MFSQSSLLQALAFKYLIREILTSKLSTVQVVFISDEPTNKHSHMDVTYHWRESFGHQKQRSRPHVVKSHSPLQNLYIQLGKVGSNLVTRMAQSTFHGQLSELSTI